MTHRRLVLIGWLGIFFGINAIGGAVGTAYDGGFEIPESESSAGFETVDAYFPGAGSAFSGSIVFQADDVNNPEVVEAMTEVFDELETYDEFALISPYSQFGASQISADGTIAFAQLNFDAGVDQTRTGEIGVEIHEMLPTLDGPRIEVGGAALAEFEPPESELIGLGFAVVILIVSFGSVLAMGLPIGVALVGVGAGGIGAVTLLSHVIVVPDFASVIGLMIGLGVGIDYALFIVTRYRELTHAGVEHEAAIIGAMDTAGRAVVFAGITVVLSLVGMLTIGLAFVGGLGIAAAVTVAFTMAASVTLLPALLGFAGPRIETTRRRGLIAAGCAAVGLASIGLGFSTLGLVGLGAAVVVMILGLFVPQLKVLVPPRKEKPVRETFWYRWSRQIQSRPWLFAIGGTVVLLVLTAPVLGLRLGFSDEGNYSDDTTTRQAYDLIAEGFGPGFNGPFLLAVEVGDASNSGVVQALGAAIGADEGVATVSPPVPNNQADPGASEAFLFQIVPKTAPQDEATTDTVKRLRSDVIAPLIEGTTVQANLTGGVPANIDFSSFLAGRIILFFAVVLGVSFLLLMMVFRSLLVPLKAVIMNMLSISAAYGVVVAIFQWGWFGGLTGIEPAPIEPFLPMMLFAIVFGLSMDYEVFLLSRVKEEYDRTGDAANSVADGLAVTARVITAAAAIMTVVFGSFLLEDDRIVKLFGTGLALAVLLDATLVRMLLVPATMELLGKKNWWLPAWLDKILPTLNVEGPALEELAPGHEPVSGTPATV